MTAIERYQALVQFVLKVNPNLDTAAVLTLASEAEALTRRKQSEVKPAAGRKTRKAAVQADEAA